MQSFSLAQINPTVGDIAGNAAKILDFYGKAKAQGAELVIFPECALIGYPPEDLVLMPSFQKTAMDTLADLAAKTVGGPAMIVGSLFQKNGKLFNAAIFMDGGKIIHVQHKMSLPNYGIFDEKRIFSTGDAHEVINWRGIKIGLLICEDIWSGKQTAELKKQGAELLIVINASPFEVGKMAQRKKVASEAAVLTGAPVIYVNAIGGQDDIVFDGGSFMMDAKGNIIAQLPEFEETFAIVSPSSGGKISPILSTSDTMWWAMKTGLKDYVEKNNFPGVVLGLSGGIDSALTAAVAVDALGANKVKGVLLSSPYTSKDSVEDAHETAKLLGIETMSVPITPAMEIFDEVLSPVFKEAGWMSDVAVGGNVQARLRAVTLMAISNKFGWLLLSTANKSEIAVGYSTLYGDSCGGYNVLKDLYKTQIYALARWRNGLGKVIPERSITKAPTAELAPGQKDSDQLPPYDELDSILIAHLEERQSAAELIAAGFPKKIVEKVVKMVRMSEYKRRQSCPGVKLSPMLFGKDRRYPLTSGWKQ